MTDATIAGPTEMTPSMSSAGYVNASLNMETNSLYKGNNATSGSIPSGMAYDTSTGTVYVADTSSGYVTLLNAETGVVRITVFVGYNVHCITYDSANKLVYVGVPTSHEIAVLNGSNVVDYTPVRLYPYAPTHDTANRDSVAFMHIANTSNHAPGRGLSFHWTF